MRVCYRVVGVGYGEIDLLVFFIDVDFGSCGYFHVYGYLCFYDAEAGCEYGCVGGVVSVYLYGVISGGFELYVIVGQV